MRNNYLLLSFALLISMAIYGQTSQTSIAIMAHTRGSGIQLRNITSIHSERSHYSEIALVSMKSHKQERSLEIPATHIYGKITRYSCARLGYGQYLVLAPRKNPNQIGLGIAGSGGLSLGLSAPVYVNVVTPTNSGLQTERYNPDIHDNETIESYAPFTHGLKNLKGHPGAFTKFCIVLEWGSYIKTPNRLEIGSYFDFIPGTPQVMYNVKPKSTFLTFYINFAVDIF
jgi:hypothetical protein